MSFILGELVDYDANAKEEYICNRLRADRDNACMGMHYNNDPNFHVCAHKYVDNKTRIYI